MRARGLKRSDFVRPFFEGLGAEPTALRFGRPLGQCGGPTPNPGCRLVKSPLRPYAPITSVGSGKSVRVIRLGDGVGYSDCNGRAATLSRHRAGSLVLFDGPCAALDSAPPDEPPERTS